jgi:hypothetical protein
MDMRKKHPFFVLVMISIVLLITACSQTTTGSTVSSLSPLQVIQNSSKAMQQLKSSHLEVQMNNTIQATGSSTVNTPAVNATTITTTPVATTTAVPQNLTINVKGSGDQALPNAMQLKLAVNTLNQTTNLSQIIQGDKVYIQNAEGKWYVMNRSDLQGYIGNPFSGFTIDQNSLLGLVQNARIIDHGAEKLNGADMRHISADLDKIALRQLLSQNPDLKSAVGQQNLDALLNNTKTFKSSVDVWIDEIQFYVHRTQLKLNLVADTSKTGSPSAPQTISTDFNATVDLSKFNDPVTITPPTDAIPTDNPGAVIGIGKP